MKPISMSGNTHSEHSTADVPEPGQIVHVRNRPFVVSDVARSDLPISSSENITEKPQHRIKLSSVEDEGLGEELEVIWEIEPGTSISEKAALPALSDFDEPRRFDAFIDSVAWGAVSSADDKALQSPFRSGIEVDDYQLDPVVRALAMPRVNLLIADDVGLGKTIETGLVAQELILRHRVQTILVICPSSIQIQWKEEMREKFGMEFRIVDSELLKDLRRRRGIHVNPWEHYPRLITSIDFLKRERPMRLFRETLPSANEPAFPRCYDLMIVDEAHNVAPSGRGKYSTDSLRTTAIRILAPHFEHKLFLTATPHNGYSESFTALLELLDNQRFARAVPLNRKQLETAMVRRLKSELEVRPDGTRRFAKRIVNHLEVDYTEAEKNTHRLLREYGKLRLKSAAADGDRMANEFVLKLLKKRLFSSPAAFATTLEKHATTVGAASRNNSKAWQRQAAATEDDYSDDEEKEQVELGAVEAASRNTQTISAAEKQALSVLREFAQKNAVKADRKALALIEWLNTHIKPGGKWSDNRVIIFTEYRATQNWLHDLLAAHGYAKSERLLTVYGGMDSKERERIKAAFQTDPKDAPVRILLATDTASEGVNLQNYCSLLIHYEIPWNPNRLEQRNGRVDRHGQKAEEVNIYHFVGAGFNEANVTEPGELEGDLEFLLRAALKVEAIREDLGKVGPVIASQVEDAMLGRRKTLNTEQAEKDSEPVRSMLKFERKLREQLEKLAAQLHETENALRLSPENIQNVVEVGLTLASQPGLIPTTVPGTDLPAFHLPALKDSWARCLEGLAHPHTEEVRPVVFDHDVAVGRDDVILCHLNHRLVQMCLRLLREELWSQGTVKKLHRFTARIVEDEALDAPAVIAHGRLLVLGGDNQRVHEEIILAGGMIKDGRFNRMNVGETRAAHEAATAESAPGYAGDSLKALWPKLEDPLMQSLEARMTERTKNLQSFLDDRSEKEVANLTMIMEELGDSIRQTLRKEEDPQLKLNLDGATAGEKSQREQDMAMLRHRLEQIPEEMERETKQLRDRYRDPQPRLLPVAVTFLIPRKAVAQLKGGPR